MRKKSVVGMLVLFVCVLLLSPMASALSPEQLKNAMYQGIYEEPVQLSDGRYEGPPFVEGGASRPTVTFINELSASGDLDGDGSDDAAAILVESSGGSGSFRYLAAILNQDAQPINEATLLLGDRVNIKSIAIQDGRILVEFIEQNEKIRKVYHIQDNTLVESGSENLGALSLSDLEGPTWVLTALNPGQDLVPETEITAVFGEGTISGSSGCNSYSAGVTAQGQGTLSIGPAMGTMMACAEPVMEQEGDFMAKLAAVSQFSFSGGQLLLTHETGALLLSPRTSGPGQPEALAIEETLEAMTIYPIGWSEDGHFAYVAERPVQSCTQCYFFALSIQDLLSDEIVWDFSYGGENPEFSDSQAVWEQHASLFEEHLAQYHIVWNTEAAMLEEFPLVTQDDEVTVSVEKIFVPEDVELPYGSGRLQQAEIVMTSKANGSKSLHTDEFGEYKPADLSVRGYLRSPFEARIAVIIAEERLGAEIQPHVMHYRFIGASLTAGFK